MRVSSPELSNLRRQSFVVTVLGKSVFFLGGGSDHFHCPEAPNSFRDLKQPGFETPKHLRGVQWRGRVFN